MRKLSKVSVNIHDKSQLETILDYNFSTSRENSILGRKQKYNVDVYFFFPPQMNLTKSSYSKDDFYEDLRPLIRLKEPDYNFIPKDANDFAFVSPFHQLKLRLIKAQQDKKVSKVRKLSNDFSLLACSISTYVSRSAKTMARDLKYVGKRFPKNSEKTEDIHREVHDKLKELFQVFKEWQLLFNEAQNLDHQKFQDLLDDIRLLDENILSLFYRGIGRVYHAFDKYYITPGNIPFKRLQKRLNAWFFIIRYNQKNKPYFVLTTESSNKDKENHAIRLAYLKKKMWSVLYLQIKDKASFFHKRQIAYMTAAGFAAIWALVANLLIWHKLNFQGYNSFFDYSEGLWGVSSSMLVFAFICAYILKDRIKELGRDKFQGGVFNYFPDSTEQIWYYNKFSKKKAAIGTIYESQQHIDDIKSIPDEIRQFRIAKLKRRFFDHEDIIHYQKKILLNTKKIRKFGHDLTAVKDIMRLSIKRYITRLDDPEEKNYLMSPEGVMVATTLPKVYYIDMVIKYSQKSPETGLCDVVYDCRRIVLNKEGLIRVLD